MNRDDIRAHVLTALRSVAPEADPADLDPDEAFQDQLDIDSIDFLNFLMAVHERTGVDIPERDYARVMTLNACVDYVIERAPEAVA